MAEGIELWPCQVPAEELKLHQNAAQPGGNTEGHSGNRQVLQQGHGAQ
jgi:hypothetical protein